MAVELNWNIPDKELKAQTDLLSKEDKKNAETEEAWSNDGDLKKIWEDASKAEGNSKAK